MCMLKRTVLKDLARRTIRSQFHLAILRYTLSDAVAGLAFTAGRIESNSGTPHEGQSIEKSIGYIETVFGDYKKYGKISRFYGKVAEVGPGDNCGVGLLFVAEGCSTVDLVDRFYSRRNSVSQSRIYSALLEGHPNVSSSLHDANLENEETFAGIRRWYGAEAAAERFFQRVTPTHLARRT